MCVGIVIALIVYVRGKDYGKNAREGEAKSMLKTVERNALTKVRFLLKWAHDTNYIGAFVAQERGFFAKKGLEVSIQLLGQQSSVESLVGSGKAEFGYSYQEGVTLARAADSPILIVAIAAVLQHNHTGFAGLKSSGIQTPKDFEGKRYSAFGSDMEKPTLDDIMSAFGGDVGKVVFVPFGGDFFQSIQAKLFDFRWVFEAWEVIKAREKNIDLFYIPLVEVNPVFDYYTPTVISSEKYLAENRDVAMRFMSALKKGYEWSVAYPEEAAAILYETEPSLDKNLVLKSAEFLASKFIDDAPSWGLMKQEPWDNYTNWLKEKKLVDASFTIDEAYTNSFLQE